MGHILNTPSASWSVARFPKEVQNYAPTVKEPAMFSALRNGGGNVALNAYAAQAVVAWMKGEHADMALVDVGGATYAAELPQADGTVLIATVNRPDPNGKTVRLRAAIAKPVVGTADYTFTSLPTIDRSCEVNLAPIYLCLLPIATSIWNGVGTDLNAITQQYNAGTPFDEGCFRRICDTLVVMLNNNEVEVKVPGGNIDILTGTSVKSGSLSGTELCGKACVLCGSIRVTATKAHTFASAKKLFSAFAASHSWSAAERALIPQFPDDYPVAPEAIDIAKKFVNTRKDKRPMNNFMWRGITSYGKSTGVELMAGFLNIPLLRMTCNSTMETQNFLSDIIPDTDGAHTAELPDFAEIAADPASAYFKLTGVEDEDATCQMALEAYGKAAASNGSVARYKFVESNYVKALEHGYIVEVQEISRIRDAGVLVGLNEYDRAGAMIPLVDGRFVRRHPDAMVVYTDNVGYASCRPVDPSVIRRCAFVIDSYELTKETLLARVRYNTGFPDKDLLEKMYTVWLAISKHCKENDITEGSISATELEMWAQSVQVDGMSNVRENCRCCVVSKATSVVEEQEEIMGSVVDLYL